jgi:hypothetical protein
VNLLRMCVTTLMMMSFICSLNTVKSTAKNVTQHIDTAQKALQTARENFNDIPGLMKHVTDTLKELDSKNADAARSATEAAAPDPVGPDSAAAAGAPDTVVDEPTLAQLIQSFADIEKDERFKKKDEYVVESQKMVDEYEQMRKTFMNDWKIIWPKDIMDQLLSDNKEIINGFRSRMVLASPGPVLLFPLPMLRVAEDAGVLGGAAGRAHAQPRRQAVDCAGLWLPLEVALFERGARPTPVRTVPRS